MLISNLEKQNMPNKTFPVVVQEWIESERGWGQRTDGYSVHLNAKDLEKYIQEYWDREKKTNPSGVAPDCYVRPDGNPFLRDIDKTIYKKLENLKKQGKHGMTILSLSVLDTKEQKQEREKIRLINLKKETDAKEKLELLKRQALAKLTEAEKSALKLT